MEDVNFSSPEMSSVLEDIEDGKIRLPNFQRDFRWERSNITELIISLLNGYPIGVLLFLFTNKGFNSVPNRLLSHKRGDLGRAQDTGGEVLSSTI
jgi:uncharacterized protein with ParB-like and HNH nuclease domain